MAVEPITSVRAGEQVIFRLVAPAGNRDPAAIDIVSAVITTSNGDRDVLTVFETAPDSGVFTGSSRARGFAGRYTLEVAQAAQGFDPVRRCRQPRSGPGVG